MPIRLKLIIWGIGVFIAFLILIMITPFTLVSAGERAIILRFGAVDRVLDSGIHWVAPFIESVEKLDVRNQKEQVESSAASKDLQTVTTVVALNFNLVPDQVGLLWKEIGKDYKVRVIDPAIQEAIKASTARYTAEELITKRELVRDDIKTLLKERLKENHVAVLEVSIVDFKFSEQFETAIELKVTAEQNALASKNKLEQVKFEAEQRVATAEAEAKAISLQSEAASNEKYVSLKALEVQLEFAKKWNGVLPVNLYGSAPIPFLQITK